VSLESGILRIFFIRHSKVHTESQKEHRTKSLSHKSTRSTWSLEIFLFIAVVSEIKVDLQCLTDPLSISNDSLGEMYGRVVLRETVYMYCNVHDISHMRNPASEPGPTRLDAGE
jgi:hypothetical protein